MCRCFLPQLEAIAGRNASGPIEARVKIAHAVIICTKFSHAMHKPAPLRPRAGARPAGARDPGNIAMAVRHG
jgi:hypothetical protein